MDFLEFTNSPLFLRIGNGMAVMSLAGAIGFLFYGMSYYGRGRENPYTETKEPPWGLLFATWKDSLIITLLFVC